MLTPRGRERDEAEFATLLEEAGFRLTRIVPPASPVSVVEGERLSGSYGRHPCHRLAYDSSLLISAMRGGFPLQMTTRREREQANELREMALNVCTS